jgi:hypothetical protein
MNVLMPLQRSYSQYISKVGVFRQAYLSNSATRQSIASETIPEHREELLTGLKYDYCLKTSGGPLTSL